MTATQNLELLLPKLEEKFADWNEGDVPTKNISEVKNVSKPIIYLMDKYLYSNSPIKP